MSPEKAVVLMAFIAGLFFVVRPLVGGIARRIGRDPGPPAVSDGAMDELRAELEDAHRRIAGLEERVDFAERTLAKQEAYSRLAPPRSN